MKINVLEATDAVLNFLVAFANNLAGANFEYKDFLADKAFFADLQEEQEISLKRISSALWDAEMTRNGVTVKADGPTPVVAAFRAYSAFHLGGAVVDLSSDMESRLLGLLPPPTNGRSEADFKNFHRALSARFGFPHDEKFWWRDLVSLEEAIAKQVSEGDGELKKTLDEADRRAGAAERGLAVAEKSIASYNEWLSKAKKQWGVHDNVSFDVVWEQALKLKSLSDRIAVTVKAASDKALGEIANAKTANLKMPSVLKGGEWILAQESDEYIDFDKKLYMFEDLGNTSVDVRLTFNKKRKTAYFSISLKNNDGNTVDWEKDHSIHWNVALQCLHDIDGCNMIPVGLEEVKS